MANKVKVLFLTMAILGQLLSYAQAVPLATLEGSGSGSDTDIDIDDSEVIEITANGLDEDAATSPQDAKDVIDLSFYGNAMYGQPDQQLTAELVANYTADAASVNPEELGSYLEGDILVPTSLTPGELLTKNGVTTQSSRWPNGIVPFEIRGNFGARDMATIEHAIEEYHRRTCIRFVQRRNEADYISIVSGNSGCWSSVGRVGGKQEVNLQSPGCLGKPGTALHELMHALGFLHEQNRMERDGYVSIQYENIQQSAVSNFEKAARTLAFGVPYDYGSVMHYSPNAFSTNGRPTIVAVQGGADSQMGQRNGFSAFDVEKLNQMYNCGGLGGGAMPGAVAAPQFPMGGPGPMPMPMPMPGTAAGNNNIVSSFLGGLISGLGLGDEEATVEPKA